MSEPSRSFRQDMLKLGIISFSEQDTLWSIASKCAKTVGVPMGAGAAVIGLNAGAVVVPGVGAVPGALAAFLAGLTTGTMACTALNLSYRKELRKLLD